MIKNVKRRIVTLALASAAVTAMLTGATASPATAVDRQVAHSTTADDTAITPLDSIAGICIPT